MDIKIIILDREQLEGSVTVDFVNLLTDTWILRLDIWLERTPQLTLQWVRLEADDIELFLGILHVATNLLNRLREVGAKSFREVSEVVNAVYSDGDDVTFSLN